MVSYKRMDETTRRVFYKGHPPACTCNQCTKMRLRKRYPKWFWIIALLLPPIGSIIVGLLAGLKYRRRAAGAGMIVAGITIAWFVYKFYWHGNLQEMLGFWGI